MATADNDLRGKIKIASVDFNADYLDGTLTIAEHNDSSDLVGSINIFTTNTQSELDGTIRIKEKVFLNGSIIVRRTQYAEMLIYIEVPNPEVDLEGTINVHGIVRQDAFNINIVVPIPEIDLTGQIVVRHWSDTDFPINIRVPTNVYPTPPPQVNGNYIIEIPFPYKQFTDTEFILTQVTYPGGVVPKPKLMISAAAMASTSVDNLFIPQRLYSRYDEYHLLLSNELDLNVGDEIRFTFCHNDAKYHIKKMEMSFDAQGNASYYFLDPSIPYKKKIDDIDIKMLVFVNRRQVLLNIDYTIDTDKGILTFINNNLATQPNDKIDIVCFYTGIDDTAIADLPMSGYIYLKRNMIDRNYNNNLMATFINGKLIERDKILHISNNIYKVKEDIKTRHDLQILNMSNRIDCMVPFYKQATQYPPFDVYGFNPTTSNITDEREIKFMEYCMPISVTVLRYVNRRQHVYMYHNPIYFDPIFLLENKDMWISFNHVSSPAGLSYKMTFYDDDVSMEPSKDMQVKLELHFKSPFEETMEESRSTIILCVLPPVVTGGITNDYCYASIQIKQIINLDIWNNRFLESCDGVTIRMESGLMRTYQDTPAELYYTLDTNKFEDYEKEQITIFEYRISDHYDGLGNVTYRKELAFDPEDYSKELIRLDEDFKI